MDLEVAAGKIVGYYPVISSRQTSLAKFWSLEIQAHKDV